MAEIIILLFVSGVFFYFGYMIYSAFNVLIFKPIHRINCKIVELIFPPKKANGPEMPKTKDCGSDPYGDNPYGNDYEYYDKPNLNTH